MGYNTKQDGWKGRNDFLYFMLILQCVMIIWGFKMFNTIKSFSREEAKLYKDSLQPTRTTKRTSARSSFNNPSTKSTHFVNNLNSINVTQRREAIVIVIKFATPCFVERMKHFMATFDIPNTFDYYNELPENIIQQQQQQQTTIQRDVWVIHSHFQDDEKAKQSMKLLNEIPNIKLQEASQRLLAPFDTKRSQSAKSSFLRLIKEHGYDFGWHLENDLFYTGPWTEVFNHPHVAHDTSSDVIAYHHQINPKLIAQWYKNKPCKIHGRPCYKFGGIKTMWYIVRVSKRFVTTLLKEVQDKISSSGHHEGIVYPFCQYYEMKMSQLPPVIFYKETLKAGGFDAWQTKSTQTITRHGNATVHHRLFHPVSCVAYDKPNASQTISQVLNEWT